MRKKMSKKNKKIDKLLDGLLDEESKSNTLIMHSETKKALLDDTIELLKENGVSVVENDFVPKGEVFCVKKGVDDTSPEVVYGQDITYLPYSVMPKPPIYREPEVKSKLKLKLARSNINDVINTDDGTVTFTLSFYKKKDCYHLYYNLEVRHQADAGGPVEVIDKIKIPDSCENGVIV